MTVVTVPTTIVALHHRGVISGQAAWRKLALIKSSTAPELIEHASAALAALGA